MNVGADVMIDDDGIVALENGQEFLRPFFIARIIQSPEGFVASKIKQYNIPVHDTHGVKLDDAMLLLQKVRDEPTCPEIRWLLANQYIEGVKDLNRRIPVHRLN